MDDNNNNNNNDNWEKKKSNSSLSYVYFYSFLETTFYCITVELHLLDWSIVIMNLGFIKVVRWRKSYQNWWRIKMRTVFFPLFLSTQPVSLCQLPTKHILVLKNWWRWCNIEDFIFSSTNISKPASLFWRVKVISIEALNPEVYIFSLCNNFFFLFHPFLEKKVKSQK